MPEPITEQNGRLAEPDPINVEKVTVPFADPLLMTQSLFVAFQSFQNSSYAYQRDRIQQRQMLNDLDITAPLDQRALSVANLSYSIVPQDESDLQQQAECSAIENALKQSISVQQLLHRLEYNSIWYGTGAEEITWARMANPIVGYSDKSSVDPETGEQQTETAESGVTIVPAAFRNLHSDSMIWALDGTPGILVNGSYKGPTFQGQIGHGAPLTRDGLWDGQPTPNRNRFILHTYNAQAADYQEAEAADQFYRGRGLRDELYWWWFFKNNALQLYLTWVERFAFGLRVGKCPNNTKAIQAMEDALNNLSTTSSTVLPVVGSDDPNSAEIEIHESSGTGAQFAMTMIQEYLAAGISLRIIGQRLTMSAEATGLGSGLADQHAETFNRIVRFDAQALSESLSTDLVIPMHKANFPGKPYTPRFEFSIERVNADEKMSGIKMGSDMGLTYKSQEVYDIQGMTKPEADDEVVGGQAPDPMGFGNIEENGQRMIAFDQVNRALGEGI